jgi:hypothetical protein
MSLPRFQLVAIDCADPLALADFYSRLTGLDVERLADIPAHDVDWVGLLHEGHPTIAFQKIANYVAPTWPEGPVPQQSHLDFLVDDLDEGERHAISLGASKSGFQPGGGFRVYHDPAGHPFCLVLAGG